MRVTGGLPGTPSLAMITPAIESVRDLPLQTASPCEPRSGRCRPDLSLSNHLLLSIDCYCNNLRISCGAWLACANTEMPACCNTLDWVNLAVSAAKSAS